MKKKTVFSVSAAFISTFAIWLHLKINDRELLTLVLAVGLYFLFRNSFSHSDRRIKTASFVLGILFGLFYTLHDMSLFYGQTYFLRNLLICFTGLGLLFSAVLDRVFSFFKKAEFALAPQQKITAGKKCAVFFGSFALIYLYFVFWLLLEFPGTMSIDSFNQLMQSVGLLPYSNHHPLVHTLLIRFWYTLGLKLFDGNQNSAMALYCAFQTFVMAGCFAFFFETLYISRLKIKHILVVLLAFFVVGYHGTYSVTVWKDVLFAGWTLVLSCTIWRLCLFCAKNPQKTPVLETVLLFVIGLLFCLFRSNGLYAFVICVPFLFAFFIKKAPAVSFTPIIVLLLAFVIKGPVFSHFGVVPSDLIESLAVPAQHIARAVRDGAELSEDEYALLSEVIDVPSVPAKFTPSCADAIKDLVREKDNQEFLKENLGEFFRLWLKLGLRNPISYLNAQIDLTSGYWYPENNGWAFTIELIAEPQTLALFELHKDCKLPQALYSRIQNLWVKFYSLPLISLVFSIGTGLYFTLTAFGVCFVKKAYSTMLTFLPVLAVIFTLLIATPINDEFRYIYGLFTTLPLLCVIPFVPIEKTFSLPIDNLKR